jgi:hypothetical protein
MDKLTAFLTGLIALSIGVERIVEILKGLFKWLRDDPPPAKDEDGKIANRRRAVLQIIAVAAGAIASFVINPHAFLPIIPDGRISSPQRWGAAILLGFLASGGSALWNHVLDIVAAIKDVKEKVASTTKP